MGKSSLFLFIFYSVTMVLLILHGALGDARQFEGIHFLLSAEFRVECINFSGHGGRELSKNEWSIPSFANEVLQFMDEKSIDKVAIIGYSLGGYVGLYLAKHFPEKVEKLLTLSTKLQWTPEIAEKECSMLKTEVIVQKVPAFAAALAQRHAPVDWKILAEKTCTLLKSMGAHNPLSLSDFEMIQKPVLVCVGDRDKMVTMEETRHVFKAIPGAGMCVIPNMGHPVETLNTDFFIFVAKNFLKN